MASGGTNQIRLRITGPDGRVSESVTDQESVILGSGTSAGVRIPDPQVSNLHLMLKRERNGAVKVIDLGSERGTHVAGRPVLEPRPLSSGDVISVGRSQVEVLFGGGGVPTSFADLGPRRDGPLPALQLDAPPPRLRPPEAPAARARPGATRAPAEPPTPTHHALQVALVWGDRVLDVKHFADGAAVRVGDSPRNHFQVFSAAVGKSLRLAVASKGKVALTLPPQAEVMVSRGGKARKATGAATLTLGLDEHARIEIENVALLVRQVRPPPGIAIHRGDRADYTFFKIASISLLAGIAGMVALAIVPRDDSQSADDLFHDSAHQVARYLVHPAVMPSPAKLKAKSTLAEGDKASEEEGKFGKPEVKKEQADPSKPGSPITDLTKREQDRQTIQRVGLLGAAARMGAKDGASNVLGPGGLGTGFNDSLGGLKTGAGMGDSHGFGGLGERGTGPGAGGTGLGLGGLGTKGKGRGGPNGGDGVDLGGLQKEVVKVLPGKTIVVGGLSKEVIFKVVKSHQREIQYCYESELNAHPDLAGKVAVVWTIGPDGSVTDAAVTETTLAAERAEQCMLSKIRRWKFPEVPGGGIVTVTFPWVFKPAGSDSGSEE